MSCFVDKISFDLKKTANPYLVDLGSKPALIGFYIGLEASELFTMSDHDRKYRELGIF